MSDHLNWRIATPDGSAGSPWSWGHHIHHNRPRFRCRFGLELIAQSQSTTIWVPQWIWMNPGRSVVNWKDWNRCIQRYIILNSYDCQLVMFILTTNVKHRYGKPCIRNRPGQASQTTNCRSEECTAAFPPCQARSAAGPSIVTAGGMTIAVVRKNPRYF